MVRCNAVKTSAGAGWVVLVPSVKAEAGPSAGRLETCRRVRSASGGGRSREVWLRKLLWVARRHLWQCSLVRGGRGSSALQPWLHFTGLWVWLCLLILFWQLEGGELRCGWIHPIWAMMLCSTSWPCALLLSQTWVRKMNGSFGNWESVMQGAMGLLCGGFL